MAWAYWMANVLLDSGCLDPPQSGAEGDDESARAKADEQGWVAGAETDAFS